MAGLEPATQGPRADGSTALAYDPWVAGSRFACPAMTNRMDVQVRGLVDGNHAKQPTPERTRVKEGSLPTPPKEKRRRLRPERAHASRR